MENWTTVKPEHRLDSESFDPEIINDLLPKTSPKLQELVRHIQELDAADMRTHGHLFKHFIYTDIKTSHGAIIISSILVANGFKHAYDLGSTARGKSFKLKKLGSKAKSRVVATLSSNPIYQKPLGIRFRKEILESFNQRPDNIHGDNIRIIIMDSGFREGIDLFDVKYVHIVEPLLTRSDERQAIGRATRFCGQKGLHFERNQGWTLHVYQYQTEIPKRIRSHILSQNHDIGPIHTLFDLFMKYTNIDPTKIRFANELEPLVIQSAVDRYLTRNVHSFNKEADEEFGLDKFFGGGRAANIYQRTQTEVRRRFGEYEWSPLEIKNACDSPPAPTKNVTDPVAVTFSPTQNFVRHYFTPQHPTKGILLMHSVGTGKTCSAIAVASTSFDPAGYTIIYVTRHTLKGDVWKNVFGLTCNMLIREKLERGEKIPSADAARKRLLDAWMEPMSYRQFTNALKNKNKLGEELRKRNGTKDPLRKTLVIIDEAHKMFAPDVSSTEKPDIVALKKYINDSYIKSGADSVRLLLMTATPYTDDPMDMMRLSNLMRPRSERIPETFEAFSLKYLRDGSFTENGRANFLNDMSGYMSYLNREKDVRSFAYPVIKRITVPMTLYDYEDALLMFIRQKVSLSKLESSYEEKIYAYKQNRALKSREAEQSIHQIVVDKHAAMNKCIAELDSNIKDMMKERRDQYEKAMGVCKELKKKEKPADETAINETLKKDKDDCKRRSKECAEEAKVSYKDAVAARKEEAAAAKKECPRAAKGAECREKIDADLKADLVELKDEMERTKASCKALNTDCVEDAKERHKAALIAYRDGVKYLQRRKKYVPATTYEACVAKVKETFKAEESDIKRKKKDGPCTALIADFKHSMKNRKKLVEQYLDRMFETDKINIERNLNEVKQLKQSHKELKKTLKGQRAADNSQLSTLDKCLKTDNIAYHDALVTLPYLPIDSDDLDTYFEPHGPPPVPNKNVFMVLGHGSEIVEDLHIRQTMPNGKILVVFAEAGEFALVKHTSHFFNLFNDPKSQKLLMDPIKNKRWIEETIGRSIHIFLPGDKLPYLSDSLFMNFEKKTGKTIFAKSGVYQMDRFPPINRSVLGPVVGITRDIMEPEQKEALKWFGEVKDLRDYNYKVYREIYRDSLYDVRVNGKHPSYKESKQNAHDILTMMDNVGAGIYYYFGCRSSEEQVSTEDLMRVRDNSERQQRRTASAKRAYAEENNLDDQTSYSSDASYHSPPKVVWDDIKTDESSSSKSKKSSNSVSDDGSEPVDFPMTTATMSEYASEVLSRVHKLDDEERKYVTKVLNAIKKHCKNKNLVNPPLVVKLSSFLKNRPEGTTKIYVKRDAKSKTSNVYEALYYRWYDKTPNSASGSSDSKGSNSGSKGSNSGSKGSRDDNDSSDKKKRRYHTHTNPHKLLGVIPNDLNVEDMRCDAGQVITNIKRAWKAKGTAGVKAAKIPRSVEDWDDATARRLCSHPIVPRR